MAPAQTILCVMYANGNGVPQDYSQAATWCRQAADQGDDEAQRSLAAMYRTGEGVPRDDAQAIDWFRKAADQGNADAQTTSA